VWFWGVTTVVVAGALRTAATAEPGVVTGGVRGVPAPVRRLVLLLCGVALSGGVAAPALATPGASHLDGHDHSGRVVLSGLPFPDRATEGGARAQTPQAVPDRVHGSGMQTHAARQVVVRPGDSLWSIAADHLAPTASDAEVATAWHALYTLNRDAIGPDPDRIEPGLRLDLPASLARPSEGASS
jgi:nucleoid-associated protein YgaU